ncbi:mucin-2 isoform X1 [Cherax quadricarinatus]
MAALDDSLTNFEGQKWSLWAERLGMNSPASDSEDEENAKSRRESTTTRLKKEEMSIYGYCPRWEDFYLVVCDVCGHAIKPQALKQHIDKCLSWRKCCITSSSLCIKDLRHGGVVTPVKSSGGARVSVSSSSKTPKTRGRIHTTNPVVKLEGRIDSRVSLEGNHISHVPSDSGVSRSNSISSSSISSSISTSSRVGGLPGSPRCEMLPSPGSLSVVSMKAEVKTEDGLDCGLDLLPPPQSLPATLPPPAPPEPPHHTLPHPPTHSGPPPTIGPPSIGPPSAGPPSIGPPSIGPPSVGPPSVGPPSVSCPSVTHQGMVTLSGPPSSMGGTSVVGVSMLTQNVSSVEEEVNKISAMLQAEAEALTASQNLIASSSMDMDAGLVGSHDIVEARGQAAGSVTTTGSGLGGRQGMMVNSQTMGSVPVPMSHMSMATLNQIQADLLATVSESDLNAVLNATPETSDLEHTVLPNNSHTQCYLNESGSLTYIDQQTVNTNNYGETTEPPELSIEKVLPQRYNNEQLSMPVLEQITNEVLSEADACVHNLEGVTADVQGQYTNSTQSDLIEVPVESFSFDEIEKISSQCDELTNAVNSITQLCQGGSSGLESQLAGLLQQPTSTPAPSPSLSAQSAPAGNSISAAPTLGTSSQGITVVIGGGAQPTVSTVASQPSLSMPTLAATLKKPVVSTGGPQLVSPGPVTSTQVHTPSHTPTHTPAHTPTHTTTQHTSGSSTLTPAPPTPSPKKSSKKKKPGERKLLPLKDREYDPEVHCGVVVAETGKPCTRSLTCKAHSLTLRRAVTGRSKKFDDLLLEHRAAKEAQTRAAKPPDAATGLVQGTPPRGPVMATTSSGGMVVGGAAATSPLLVKSLGGTATTIVTPGDPSPNPPLHHPMDPPSTPSHTHATPPSPAYWPPTPRIPPALVPADNFYVREPPKPLATCSYNCRRLGGYLASDHRADLLRSAFRNALKKPHPGSVLTDSSISNALNIGGTQERFVNVKPLLAKKLQLTVPSGSGSKDGISVSTGYNGHIHVGNSMGIVNSSAVAATLKRPTQAETLKNNATPITSAKNKNKKVKTNDGAINIVGNVLQLDASGNKNHIPVVVSLQNGLSNNQTITLSNVAIAGVRNSTTQPIRINPSTPTNFGRDSSVTDTRQGNSDNSNIFLGSGLPGGIVISDALAKSFKSDGAGSIRLELHSNTFGDASRLVTNTAKVSGSGVANTVGSGVGGGSNTVGGGVTSGSTAGLAPGQVTYLTSAVAGSGGTTGLTIHHVQQVLNRLQVQGKGGGGSVGGGGGGLSLKLLGSGQAGVTGARSTFVLQQEKEPS